MFERVLDHPRAGDQTHDQHGFTQPDVPKIASDFMRLLASSSDLSFMVAASSFASRRRRPVLMRPMSSMLHKNTARTSIVAVIWTACVRMMELSDMPS
jgi:hypothetical protein